MEEFAQHKAQDDKKNKGSDTPKQDKEVQEQLKSRNQDIFDKQDKE